MKRKTKHLILILSILFALSLCSCGSGNDDKDETVTFLASPEAKEKYEMLLSMKSSYDESYDELLTRLLAAGDPVFPDVKTNCKVEKEYCGGSEVYSFSTGDYDCIILYIHGGAWVSGIDPFHVSFGDDLTRTLNAKLYMPQYPLAPKYTYKDTYAAISALYDELLKQKKPIYVMGDSAGGTISLGLIHMLQQDGRKLPEKLVLLSPCADLSFTNPEMKEKEAVDPMLTINYCLYCAEMWAGDTALTDPYISPLYSKVSGYPDTLMFTGSQDILQADELRLYEKMKSAGDRVKLVKGEGLWHVFPVSSIPEKELSLQLIKEFCK